MDLQGQNSTRLFKLHNMDLKSVEMLDFGKDWNSSLRLSKIRYVIGPNPNPADNPIYTWLFFFHHSAREIEVTRDFKKSFTFTFDADIDSINLVEDQLVLGSLQPGFST